MSLINKTATELLKLLSSGEITSVELTQSYFDQINKFDAKVGAYLSTYEAASL